MKPRLLGIQCGRLAGLRTREKRGKLTSGSLVRKGPQPNSMNSHEGEGYTGLLVVFVDAAASTQSKNTQHLCGLPH